MLSPATTCLADPVEDGAGLLTVGTAILEKPVSDRSTLGDVSQSPQSSFKRICKLLILNGEMLERSIRHAWKTKRASNTEPLQRALTHTRSAA